MINNQLINEKTFRRSAAISRILYPSIRPCGLTQDDNHSSRPAIAGRLKQPTRKPRTGRPLIRACARIALPYLVLLRAGFCLPRAFLRARCALTAPFHPYLAIARESDGWAVYFLCHCPSSCPDRALPGALPSGVRTFLPSTRHSVARSGQARLPARVP